MMSEPWATADVEFMRQAIGEARAAAGRGEVPVGAIVVAGREVVGRGGNRSIGDHDPSGHAEIVALREAGQTMGNHRLADATLYVTLEPCAMCVGAVAQARIARLVFGAYDERAGALGSAIDLDGHRALNHRFEINGGLLADDCTELLRDFFADKRR